MVFEETLVFTEKIQGTNKMNHLYFYHPEITTISILVNFLSDCVEFQIICVHIQTICVPTVYIFVLILLSE